MPQKNGYCPALARDIEITISVYIQQTIAKIAQLVEHDLAKVGVAGSSPVFRSKRKSMRNLFVSHFFLPEFAQMVKLVDTLVSGTSGRKAVQVRVLFWAQKFSLIIPMRRW